MLYLQVLFFMMSFMPLRNFKEAATALRTELQENVFNPSSDWAKKNLIHVLFHNPYSLGNE